MSSASTRFFFFVSSVACQRVRCAFVDKINFHLSARIWIYTIFFACEWARTCVCVCVWNCGHRAKVTLFYLVVALSRTRFFSRDRQWHIAHRRWNVERMRPCGESCGHTRKTTYNWPKWWRNGVCGSTKPVGHDGHSTIRCRFAFD